MAIAVNVSNKLQLRYEKGTYSFSKFSSGSSDKQLYALAGFLNSVQAEPVKKVIRISTMQVI